MQVFAGLFLKFTDFETERLIQRAEKNNVGYGEVLLWVAY